MDREEVQSRRAYNQIWNGAGRYDIRPEQAAFDAEGDADLYMNTVMGLAYGQYDFARFQPMLHSFQQQIKGGLTPQEGCAENALLRLEAILRA